MYCVFVRLSVSSCDCSLIHLSEQLYTSAVCFRYMKAEPSPDADHTQTYETTVVFYVSSFQYIFMAFIFSKGPPYRKPIYTNGKLAREVGGGGVTSPQERFCIQT